MLNPSVGDTVLIVTHTWNGEDEKTVSRVSKVNKKYMTLENGMKVNFYGNVLPRASFSRTKVLSASPEEVSAAKRYNRLRNMLTHSRRVMMELSNKRVQDLRPEFIEELYHVLSKFKDEEKKHD